MKHYLITGVLVIIASFAQAQCHHDDTSGCMYLCCTSDPTPAGVMMSHLHPKNEWMISLQYMGMPMSGIRNGNNNIHASDVYSAGYMMSPESMLMNMYMLMGMYGLTNRTTLMSMIHYTDQNMSMSSDPNSTHQHGGGVSGAQHQMKTRGLGDAQIWILHELWKRPGKQIFIGLGYGIPSGSIYHKGKIDDEMYPQKRYPYAMQTGSGSHNLLGSLNYLYASGDWVSGVQVLGTLRLNDNRIGYRLGNEASSNLWLAYIFNQYTSASMRLEQTIRGSIKGQDRTLINSMEPAAYHINSGEMKTFLHAGVKFDLDRLRIGVEYGLPVYRYYTGIQMNHSALINIAVSTKF